VSLCGAGGGGFMLFIGRDEEATHHIRHLLSTEQPNPRARFFDFEIDQQGLAVTTL
jgi:galactokinase/mevalonate kinase-like predicted kinase